KRRTEAAVVDQLSGMFRKYVQKAWQTIELVDIGDVPHVAIQYQTDIIFEPRYTPCRSGSPQDFRIAAGKNHAHHVFAQDLVALDCRLLPCEQSIKHEAWS